MSADIHAFPKKKKRFVSVGNNLMLNTSSGIYYVKKTFDRYKIPTLFETTRFGKSEKSKAKARALELIAKHLDKYLGATREQAAGRAKTVTMARVFDEFLEKEVPKMRKRTQERYRSFLPELKEEWGRWSVASKFSEAWEDWLPRFKEKKRKKRIEIAARQKIKRPRFRETFNDYAKSMNEALKFAKKKNYISQKVSVPYLDKKKESPGRVYTDAEIRSLWENMGPTLQLQYLMCFEAMMRLREAICLHKSRFNPATGVITLLPEDVKTGSQTGKGRSFKVSPDLHERLIRQMNASDSPYFFPSPGNPEKPVFSNKTAWDTAKKRAGVKGRWHDLRHSALSRALLPDENGNPPEVSPMEVSLYSGTSMRTIEKVYLHNDAEKTARVSNVVKVPRKTKDTR